MSKCVGIPTKGLEFLQKGLEFLHDGLVFLQEGLEFLQKGLEFLQVDCFEFLDPAKSSQARSLGARIPTLLDSVRMFNDSCKAWNSNVFVGIVAVARLGWIFIAMLLVPPLCVGLRAGHVRTIQRSLVGTVTRP